MKETTHFRFTPSVIALPLFFVLVLWLVFWVEVRFAYNFNQYGIYPKTFSGLRGVFLSPFLHGSLQHLYNNSLPLLVLLTAMRYFYRDVSYKVVFFGILLSGLFTWFIGRESYHIGASGLVYVLVSFIFFKGIQTKYYRLVALSLGVVMIYGGMIWYMFPDIEKGISWEGHLG
ncbi:MAG: rhomboid family intramembrane serine protease, partial [Flavobacterium sp.]